MHRASASALARTGTSTIGAAEPAATASFSFIDMHLRGRTADLQRAVENSDRPISWTQVEPQRATTLGELEGFLLGCTHAVIQSHGVGGGVTATGELSSEPQLFGGFTFDASVATPMPHLQFLMLLACYQEHQERTWRRFAPNATLVLSEHTVYPKTFSPIAVDIVADSVLDGRLPTAARMEATLARHSDRQWEVHPGPDHRM